MGGYTAIMEMPIRMYFELLGDDELECLVHDALQVARSVPPRVQRTGEFLSLLSDLGWWEG